jgi:hypothetical protein
MQRNIALIGKARAGKDSAAAHLVASRSYTRLAFADALKTMAMAIDPIVAYGQQSGAYYDQRLSNVVGSVGWEAAKDNYPEVRRFLQNLGQGVREREPNYWLSIVTRQIQSAKLWNMPVVVTDVRYRNEAQALKANGFKLVRLTRGAPSDAQAAQHISETELDDFPVDQEIVNNGSMEALHAMIAAAVE